MISLQSSVTRESLDGHAFSMKPSLLLLSRALSEALPRLAKRSSPKLQTSLWHQPQYIQYIKKHLDPLNQSIDTVREPKTIEKVKEIQDVLNLISRRSISPNPELLSSSAELWDKLIQKTYTTKGVERRRSKGKPKVGKVPDELFELLLSLPAQLEDWTTFDLFWAPIAGSPLALEIVPELITRAIATSPTFAFDLLMRIDNDNFFPQNEGNAAEHHFLKARYTKAIIGGLNAFLQRLMQPPYLEGQTSKYWNLMYETFDQLNRNIDHISLLPTVAQTLPQRIPRHAFADFYAILLLRKANFQSTHLKNLPEQLLFNGTDAEQSLIVNADKLIAAKRQLIEPIFSLKTYQAIVNHLGRRTTETNTENLTWLLDNVVSKYAAHPKNLSVVLNTILRRAADSGDMTEAAAIYEYMIQKDNVQPCITTYANLFRGFRKLAPTLGDYRCFEVLSLIHNKGLEIPPFLCTEILALINARYHGLIVFQFYKAYFGEQYLQELGIVSHFDSLYVPNIEKPDYTPSIYPDHINDTRLHPFNPVALGILYKALLGSVSTLAQVLALYKAFRELQFPCPKTELYSIYDCIINTLCAKFKTNESLSLAKSILDDMVLTIPLPLPDNNQSMFTPYKYSGTQLTAFGTLIKGFCEKGNIDLALEVLDTGLKVSPFVGGDMFAPVIQYYMLRHDRATALTWLDAAKEAGASIRGNDALVAALEEYREYMSANETSQHALRRKIT